MSEEQDMINEVPGSSPEFRTELAEQLAELAPEAIADGKIDVEKLKELLEGDASDTSERFGLFWPGKKRSMRAAQTPTTATLRPDKENSKDWDTTKNVFIEGDNLEVLKILQKHYHGKIKMIYIDPPYNTGNDFVYPDNYKEGLQTYLEWSKQVNEDGKKLSSNSESEGRYHSNWLNMMYPRLKLARNLLTDDGVIFVSIDDNEAAHLRKLLDQIFGENNFVAAINHKARGSVSNDKIISPSHNTIYLYARRFDLVFNMRKGIGLDPDLSGFDYEDARGAYKLVPVDGPGGARKGNPYYEFLGVEGYFRYSKQTMQELYDAGEVVKRGNTLQRKYYRQDAAQKRKTDTTWWDTAGYTSSATSALKKLLGGAFFDSPKPVSLIERMLTQFTENDALVLDFFGGSGTTAHATVQLNAKDGGNRKYILVQLPEPTPEKSEASKSGFKTIPEISRHRLALSGEQIENELGEQLAKRDKPLDIGFRSYKLADTDFTKWRTDSDIDANQLEQHLLDLRESADDNATADDLLTEILLKQGHSLVEQIRDHDIDGLSYKSVVRVDDEDGEEDTLVLAYLDEHTKPTLAQLREAMEVKPAQFVMLEDAFQGDDELKTNLAQICKTNDIELWTA
ncbi:site-specific DNA-methyltransferase [Corynebacterium accolens]|jgi:type III restriction-modification system DNA-methyltransferase|uniref:site-specific DNA-methyltransferase n=1 Tax=Corynebacterium accolens TaxID=38284 RepID=UPI0025434875|nr:site-specific DNA-methyltransferase [Corynebacterium accolens]MDK4294227.1 site-specific DNA-methyltransferase [Corynebacterium accolens]MDK8680593.1 site-specific DNA-methyltransferase [Corynebacterium accolens]WKS62665.1 site-specific DNA-methyltransferase [Corynebacterium accolens]